MSWFLADEKSYRKTYQSWVSPDGEMPMGIQGVIVERKSSVYRFPFVVRVYKDREVVCGNVEKTGKAIAKFHLCSGCIEEMNETYKDVL